MDDSAVMAVLKTSRKARKQTTCYPCQRRKVKCDRGLPCSVCVSRGHSFLCSYGRPTEASKTIPPQSAFTSEDGSGSGSQSQHAESQMLVLREQLNHFHEQLQHARKRHKQCEEAEDQVRRLQARCREYEHVHAKLRAGDWSALERINESVRGESDTSSTDPDSCAYSQDAGSRDGNEFGVWADISSTNDVAAITTGTVQGLKRKVMSAADNSYESAISAIGLSEVQQISPPICSTPDVQQTQNFFDQVGGTSSSATVCYPSGVVLDERNPSCHHEERSQSALQASGSNRSNHEYMLHQMVSSSLQPNQTTLPSASSEERRGAAPLHPVAPASSSDRPDQLRANALQPSSFISDSHMTSLSSLPERMEVTSGVSWTQFSLFPPMIFGQDQELMERSYADYWARIVVEAQRSPLLAG